MSEKFENEVLRMLQNNDKDIKKVLEKVDNLEKAQERLEANQEKVDERLEAGQQRLEERQDKLEARQENFEKFQHEFNMRVIDLYKELKEEVTNTKNELIKLSNHFTAFEYDINRNVDLLLENYDFDRNQFIKNNADIFDLQEKYSNHDCRITNLVLKAAMP